MLIETIGVLGGGAGIAAVLTALAALLKRSKHTVAELSPNHGGSMKDQLDWLVEAFKTQQKYLESERASTHELRGYINDRLDGHDREIKELKDGQKLIGQQVKDIDQKLDRLIHER